MGLRLLIVDDEEMIRTLNRKILEREGFQVAVASSGSEAIALADKADGQYDLAVVDQTMPGISGLETIKSLQARFSRMRFLLCTGQVVLRDDLPKELQESTAVLLKPYRAAALVAAIKEVLGHPTP